MSVGSCCGKVNGFRVTSEITAIWSTPGGPPCARAPPAPTATASATANTRTRLIVVSSKLGPLASGRDATEPHACKVVVAGTANTTSSVTCTIPGEEADMGKTVVVIGHG